MSNRLSSESSLYLRQHAENPVDWMPWGDEAFTKARSENKPILVSIGYSSCHWCHVMAHESFENDYIARLMNKHFVCIKVDREERPDIDRIYMEAVQMINQHGGWPLNVFCLPDGRPFYGGTYFPPEDRGQGMIPWPQLIMRVSEYFHSKRPELEENAGSIVGNLEHLTAAAQSEGSDWSPRELLGAVKKITESLDPENGGFGGAPKFPPSMVIQFLLAMRQTRACGNEFPKIADAVDHSVTLTLDRMATGGLFDQVGGGFCRYCVDVEWTIPHFEKMLYDNALILETYAMAWSRYRVELYQRVVEETVEWLDREMKTSTGLYAASIDADSPEGEGRFYCWTPDQLNSVLGKETGELFSKVYGVTDEGNFEEGLTYPQFQGSMSERQTLAEARIKLREERSKRPRPVRDDKELTFWNALVARALLHAGTIFRRKDWVERGGQIIDLLWENHREGERLYCHSGTGATEGFLDDYATLAHASLVAAGRGDIFEPKRCAAYRGRAEELARTLIGRFGNEEKTAYFFVSDSTNSLIVRQIDWYDNATPSGNSTMANLLSGLSTVSNDPAFEKAKNQLRQSYASLVSQIPNGVAYALAGWCQEASGLVRIKAKTQEDLTQSAQKAAKRCWRFQHTEVDESLPNNNWQVCVRKTCLPNSTTPAEAAEVATMAAQPR